jgi:hypothetical protein
MIKKETLAAECWMQMRYRRKRNTILSAMLRGNFCYFLMHVTLYIHRCMCVFVLLSKKIEFVFCTKRKRTNTLQYIKHTTIPHVGVFWLHFNDIWEDFTNQNEWFAKIDGSNMKTSLQYTYRVYLFRKSSSLRTE